MLRERGNNDRRNMVFSALTAIIPTMMTVHDISVLDTNANFISCLTSILAITEDMDVVVLAVVEGMHIEYLISN